MHDDRQAMDPILATGLDGIVRGSERVAESSARVAKAFSPPETSDGVAAIIELQLAAQQVRASAKIVNVGREVQDAILSVIA